MGRWTPLILMAGGLAILLGTLLGINFPMGGQQSAKVPPVRQAEGVLPANINVNSTASRNDSAIENRSSTTSGNNDSAVENRSSTTSGNGDSAVENRRRVAQNNASTETAQNTDDTSDTTPENSATEAQSTTTPSENINQDKEPIRALW
ncbi:hypothetical protein [Cylindrospermum sp. FACHB-282]|uniref:hypothetical protein n=1 Tax=Cylindrospermum sp. FACHB-282 TaxID=2692794 RepID=UPI001685F3B0|nr:hypothetical protein [Cylindrospermum sp. FACHB-282]MBD2384880.1 hypothetical protein [Cylindrospermum sp. FACHB-282]